MKQIFIMRLDDASEKRNIKNWDRIEELLAKYNIKPIVGIIPKNQDPDFENYEFDKNFNKYLKKWKKKDWIFALHGFNHVFKSNFGGINPVNNRSEFAGINYEEQKRMILEGLKILKKWGIEPTIFFAPAHTYDENTIKVLLNETNIRIISDTIASNIYYENGMYYIPQQSGKCRKLPFKVVTFCYHPNNMSNEDFLELELFLEKNNEIFGFPKLVKRKRNVYDKILKFLYFSKRKLKR